MSTSPDGRLQRLLGGENLASLRKRLRQRFERAPLDEDPGSVRISNLLPDEHAALALLLGRSPRFSSSLQIDVSMVDAALSQAGIAASLRHALELLDGPIVHMATARMRLQALWSGVVGSCHHPDLAAFLHAPTGIGLLKRLSDGVPEAANEMCRRVDAVLGCLPAKGVTRAQLAADVLGDAHALDNGQPTATLVLAVWRQATAPVRRGPEDPPRDDTDESSVRYEILGETARDVWASAGVLVNELARPVMFLNLPVADGGALAPFPGEPGYASLRFLLRSPPSWAVAGRNVYVCENPNLVAIAADKLGPRCAPLVCTDGMPAAAQGRLLTQLSRAGGCLQYHGDFDWPGLRIANYVMREYGARPWRYGAAEYAAAVRTAPRPGHRLRGPEVVASWDTGLTPAMRTSQLAIAEESVATSLLEDLLG